MSMPPSTRTRPIGPTGIRRRACRFGRFALAVGVLPCLWVGGASARYVIQTQRADRQVSRTLPFDLPIPRPEQRFLIVSPHPDDETLACGGLIRNAVIHGAAVRVLFVTNGDGFRAAAGRQYRKLGISPSEYVRFGELRRREALAALAELGLDAQHARFAGMPDGILMRLWRNNWSDTMALRSATTGTAGVPYRWAVRPGAPCSGASVLSIITREIVEFEPTDILAPHPSDDHGDHSATSAFVQMALAKASGGTDGPHPSARLRYYLIHRGDWPQPQGYSPNTALAPPADMLGLDTEWRGLRLSQEDVQAKLRAVKEYRSQVTLTRRFLMSFVRNTEFVGTMPEAVAPKPDGELLGASASKEQMLPIVLDPVDDNLVRRSQRYADIRAISALASGSMLSLRIETVGRPSSLVRTRVCLRYLGDEERGTSGGACNITVYGRQAAGSPDVRVDSDSTSVWISVPLRNLGYSTTAFLDVDTSVAGVPVDRIGSRLLHIGGRAN